MDTSGRHMATAGADGQLKLWDLRMLKPLHAYGCIRPATALDISQRGMLAVGFGRRVQVRLLTTALRIVLRATFAHNLIVVASVGSVG